MLRWADVDDSKAHRATDPQISLWVVPAKKRGRQQKVEVPLPVYHGDWNSAGYCLLKLKEQKNPAIDSPVFTRADKEAFTTSDIAEVVKMTGTYVGKDPLFLGAHSLRIAGAVQLFEGGASPDGMKAAGRWGSDMAYVYINVTRNRLLQDNKKAFHKDKDNIQN